MTGGDHPMTVCGRDDRAASGRPPRAPLTIAADGSYAARLARRGDGTDDRFPERWTLSGPEPYAVPLPGEAPEAPDSALLALADGRVLIRRPVEDGFALALLYPSGPDTGELPLGTIEAPELTLLPPAPDGRSAHALTPGATSTSLWLLHGGPDGPEHLAELPGRCSGGAWLDRSGQLLAVDQELDGRTKTVAVDLSRGGETTLLLQITEESNDRLLLADPDSGLLLVRSDAPGEDRLGWGVLGSALPVRFPSCLHPADAALTPFAVQPRQMLTPEHCAVAWHLVDGDGERLGVWRPADRELRQLPSPEGWLTGSGRWSADGELLLPYVTEAVPCGLARMAVPLEPSDGLWPWTTERAVERAAGPEPVAVPVAEPVAEAAVGPVAGPVAEPVAGPGSLAGAVAAEPMAGAGPVPAPVAVPAPAPVAAPVAALPAGPGPVPALPAVPVAADVPPVPPVSAAVPVPPTGVTVRTPDAERSRPSRAGRTMQGLHTTRPPLPVRNRLDGDPVRQWQDRGRIAPIGAAFPPPRDGNSPSPAPPEAGFREPFTGAARPSPCRPVPLQEAPLSAGEARWSVITRPVRIQRG
ncbi:hypothetical protein ACGH2B_20505 [Streptomyces sp. BBFR2]|uniref:hypothetical protein n=1 Tax=Streptomyces sp. BBFR2 TaxID=3372854 RepID=UPI0037DA275D